MREQCNECQYLSVCFPLLRIIKSYSTERCLQGRKRKSDPMKPVESEEVVIL
jgi:hypothetical protein